MGFNDFKNKYNMKINFVDFYSLIHVIPRNWIRILRDNRHKIEGPIFQPVLNELLAMPKVCKGIYWKLVNAMIIKRNIADKWASYFKTQFTMEDISEYFTLNFRCTIESKMRSFQYKLLQRFITTNKFLSICGIKDDKCYFCGVGTETLEHLFWECPIVNQFWKDMVDVFYPLINLNEILYSKSILLGVRLGQNELLVNHLINILKQYIYVVRCIGGRLSVEGALGKVRETFKIEQNIISQMHMNNSQSLIKWNPILALM